MHIDENEKQIGRSRSRARGASRARNAETTEYTKSAEVEKTEYDTSFGDDDFSISDDYVNAASGKTAGRTASRAARTKAREAAGNRKSTLIRRVIIFGILEIFVLGGIFAYAYASKQYGKIQRYDVDENEVRNINLSEDKIEQMQEGYWNIAVYGVDSRDSSVGAGANSDVNIIVSINRANGEIRLVSVFRDTYLKISDTRYNKINAAYCNGGPEQAIKALNENLDLSITQYMTFNWKAVATAINILGGVDVDLSKAEYHYINSYITETVKATGIGSVQLDGPGMHHLDGVQAVAYARLRYMDNDYARTERQRKIIALCLDKAKKADAKTLNDLVGNMLEMVATNMTWQDGIDAIAQIDKYHIVETSGFPAARGEQNIGKYGDCVVPQTLESNVRDLHLFLFGQENYDPTDAVKTISKKISADSGMYKEGTAIGHVSTEGVIPASTKAAEENEVVEGLSSLESGTGDASSSNTQKKKIEYAISSDGYLIYVSGKDANGNKTYSYVLDDAGKRIKMITTDEDGNVVYLYEVDEEGNFYFDMPDNVNIPGEDEEEELGPETIPDEENYGPGSKPQETQESKTGVPGTPGQESKAETRPGETKAATKPGETSAAETKAQSKPSDVVPAETSPAETSPAETSPAETSSVSPSPSAETTSGSANGGPGSGGGGQTVEAPPF